GQILPIAAAGFVVLAAIAGLAIDTSRDYLIKRNAQNAADFAALAAAKEMTISGNVSVALIANSNAIHAAHDFAANNGFSTIYGNACDSTAGGGFTTSWFDAAGYACGATTGFTTKVSVNSPAVALPGAPVPPVCQGAGQFSCVQVVISASVGQLFASVLGINRAYVTVGAAAHATLPGSNINAPPPQALVIYQPQANCVTASQQCFDETKPVKRTLLSCSVVGNNCPTFWSRQGSSPKIYGFDGQYFIPPTDLSAVQSNGDMVIQDRTTLCDSYGGVVCASGAVKGTNGFTLAAGAKVYCSKYGAGAVTVTPCTTAGQATLNELDANQGAFSPQAYWYPTVDTTGLKNCGGLVLNGQAVYGPCLNAAEPYLIEPGFYSYIVINHGTYEFDQGLYDITGIAPVNTATGGGYTANGIDHSQETAASDFDLCTAGLANSCPTLTAGVWIGHGGGNFSAYVAPTSGSCAGGFSGANGGGGDPTIIGGNSSVFRMEPTSGGFVTTHEVTSLNIAGAGVNSMTAVGGSPLAIDLENNSFVHLDSQPGSSNQFQGIIYQTANATAGGVEVNLGMNNSGAAVIGQVLAYTFTTFGTSGTMDFSNGYGAGTVPGIQTSGKNETSIISSVTLTAAAPGYETLTVNYTDEWAMDAYDQFIKVNNGTPVFFSQGIWTSVPPPGAPQPPPTNNPGDQFPAYADPAHPGTYNLLSTGPVGAQPASADWLYNIPSSNGATIEVSGAWMWGHEKDFAGVAPYFANSGPNIATVKYTFPIPSGQYVAVTVFVSDGDRCGDYAYASHTFKNTGGPGPGQQTVGTVDLAQ
ncbi:MAG TPA: pilus assembly protein TadG-related protein, partial [Candidatus Dormibacteraeota bacterium]|nr:pilus assembly protein TadG-related protein [Candidatus Dormibacteraeota bacterium]